MGFLITPTSASLQPQCQIPDYRDLMGQRRLDRACASTRKPHSCVRILFVKPFLSCFPDFLYFFIHVFLHCSIISSIFFLNILHSLLTTFKYSLHQSCQDFSALSCLKSVALHFCRVKYVHSGDISTCRQCSFYQTNSLSHSSMHPKLQKAL